MERKLIALQYAVSDFFADRSVSFNNVLALVAVLAPLMILFGIKNGVVESLLENLKSSPSIVEVSPLGQGRYDGAFYDRLAAQPFVQYAIPTTRFLATTMDVRSDMVARAPYHEIELLPSTNGDPLLTGQDDAPTDDEILLSHAAALRLGVKAGDQVRSRIGRLESGRVVYQLFPLTVKRVLPAALLPRASGLIAPSLLYDLEAYRENVALPERGWPGTRDQAPDRLFASFRVYATDIDAVATLVDYLEGMDIVTRSAADRIAGVKLIDRSLQAIFTLIAAIAAVGCAFAMTASAVSNVDRKRRELSVLKLLGLHRGELALYPVAQAALISFAAMAIAFGVYTAFEQILNASLSQALGFGSNLVRIAPMHLGVFLAAVFVIMFSSAGLSAYLASATDPSKGLRDAL
jgi:putative ABC transport system permease protein